MSEEGMPVPGDVVAGRYRIERLLGKGGMGAVYEATQLKLARRVAIKVLQRDVAAESEFRIRFEREGRAAALLRSRHAVRVFDVDTAPEGFTYLVMELLDGRDLGREANLRGGLPIDELARWIIQACEALHEAHESGVIHRDIKPANIFVANDAGERIAKVVDFGISKFEEHVTRAITRPHDGVLGTPYFMSPEQVRGKRVDRRSDVWALGVVLYRLLAARWPFDADNDGAFMAAIVADRPVPIESVRPDLPSGLAAVVMRALERAPSDRFQTAKDLAAALAPFARDAVPADSIPPATDPMASTTIVDTERMNATTDVMPISVDFTTTAGAAPARPPEVQALPAPGAKRGVAAVVAAAVVLLGIGIAIGMYVARERRAPIAEPTTTARTTPVVPVEPPPPAVAIPEAPSASVVPPPVVSAHAPLRRAAHDAKKATPAPASAAASAPGLPSDFVPEHL